MKGLLAVFAACLFVSQSALAQSTGRSDQTGPTWENGFTVFTTTRVIEGNATSMRAYGRAYGEMEKACIDSNKSGFIDEFIQNANDFLNGLFKPGKNLADELSQAKCATIFARLKLFVDGKEILVGEPLSDYKFAVFDKAIDKTYGTEFNGKTVVAKLYVATQMNKNNVWTVFLESTTP